MKYEVKTWSTVGISMNEDGSANYTIGIISHPVGDTYGFDKGDTTTIQINKIGSKTGDEITSEVEKYAEDFVAKKYPNT